MALTTGAAMLLQLDIFRWVAIAVTNVRLDTNIDPRYLFNAVGECSHVHAMLPIIHQNLTVIDPARVFVRLFRQNMDARNTIRVWPKTVFSQKCGMKHATLSVCT